MTDRFLITTADERTWKFDRPVLFLGEWCRRYSRRAVWEGMDAVVAEPYGFPLAEKKRDLAYIQALTDEMLSEIGNALNLVHSTDYGARYWNIVLGHWLHRTMNTLFNRYFALDSALRNHHVSGTAAMDGRGYIFATTDSHKTVRLYNDDLWNHHLYARVLRHLSDETLEIEDLPLKDITKPERRDPPPLPLKRLAKQYVMGAATGLLSRLTRATDAFVINTVLPPLEEMKLQVMLGQAPQLWQSPTPPAAKFDPEKRDRFTIPAEGGNDFQDFLRQVLPDIIPTVYLEGYAKVLEQAASLPWPSRPKFIFTSASFDTHEVFKVWAATKIEEGTPYFVGQHGANYGTHFFNANPTTPEQTTSDRFFTWGWSDGGPRTVPAFNFKIAGQESERFNPRGGLLLIESMVPFRITPWDNYFEFGLRQEDQFRFTEALPEAIRGQLTVRLHREYLNQEWSDVERWKDRLPATRIEPGAAAIRELIAQSRLLVYGYDSTGMLETLAQNIPTMAFWNYGLEQLQPSAKPFFEMLVRAGILFESPEEAAGEVSAHWDGVDEWWKREEVQEARLAFCEQYSRRASNPTRKLKELLSATLKEF